MNNTDKPAFLLSANVDSYGLTKREYFAAAAMQGICANEWLVRAYNEVAERWVHIAARRALAVADALLAELEKSQ